METTLTETAQMQRIMLRLHKSVTVLNLQEFEKVHWKIM